ncbi:MAG: 4Fe-4S dicluster domain-containing protein [Pseudomonadota bacterium]
MEKAIIIDVDMCTGCRVCELTCSMTKQGEYNPKRSYIRIIANNDFGVYLPVLKTECDFCGKCIEWCPEQALKISELGETAIMMRKSKIGRFPIPLVGRL